MRKRYVVLLLAIISITILLIVYIGLSGGFTKPKYYSELPELTFYHGAILNKGGQGIDDVEVGLLNTNLITYTNEMGYFKLKGNNIDVLSADTLVISKECFVADTLFTYSLIASDYQISETYYFSRKEIDTIVMRKLNNCP